MSDETLRCAGCTCENGGRECNWIASGPNPDELTPERIKRLKAEVMILENDYGLWVTAEDYAELRAEIARAVQKAYEDAAQVAEGFGSEEKVGQGDGNTRIMRAVYGPDIARAIRAHALKQITPEPGVG